MWQHSLLLLLLLPFAKYCKSGSFKTPYVFCVCWPWQIIKLLTLSWQCCLLVQASFSWALGRTNQSRLLPLLCLSSATACISVNASLCGNIQFGQESTATFKGFVFITSTTTITIFDSRVVVTAEITHVFKRNACAYVICCSSCICPSQLQAI